MLFHVMLSISIHVMFVAQLHVSSVYDAMTHVLNPMIVDGLSALSVAYKLPAGKTSADYGTA